MQTDLSLKKLLLLREKLPKQKVVILATGVFDIFHVEHLRFLKKAKKLGDILMVGVESDKRVRHLKGKGRPINNQKQRLEVISALKPVDCAFLLPTDLTTKKGREELIKQLKPHIYAVSANTPFQKEKQRIIKKFGAKLKVIHPYNPKISTTKAIKKRQKAGKNKSKKYII